MDNSELKSYCQFCLIQQSSDNLRMPITRKIKQDFFDITQKKVNYKIICFDFHISNFSFNLK